jgi:hypothetical protein
MEQKKKKKRIILVKFICAAIMLSVVIWAISLGWFTENRETENGGVSGGSASGDYKIATVGTDGKYDDWYVQCETDENGNTETVPILQQGSKTSFYVYSGNAEAVTEIGSDSAAESEAAEDENSEQPVTGYITTGENIIWEMSADSNFNNYDSDDETAAKEISPGTWGYTDFYIIPNRTGEINISCELDLAAYCLAEDDDKPTDNIIKHNNSVYNLYTCGEDESDDLNKLIKGHLMFFTSQENASNQKELVWLVPGDNGKLSFEISLNITDDYKTDASGVDAFKAVRQRIYWIWPNVLGQAILTESRMAALNGYYDSISKILADMDSDGAVIDEDIVKSHMMTDVYDSYFYLNGDTAEVKAAKNGALELNGTAFSADDYTVLNEKWNDADQTIGKEVGFVTVEISTSVSK